MAAGILVILLDQARDATFDDPVLQIPRMRGLAARGTRFTNAYTNAPTCDEARIGLVAGRHAHLPGGSKLTESEPTLFTAFRGAGFRTGYVGKWHLTPDHLKGGPGGLAPNGYVTKKILKGVDFFAGREVGHENQYQSADYFVNGSYTPTKYQGYWPVQVTDISLRFLRKNADRDFLLFVSYEPPHPSKSQYPLVAGFPYDPSSLVPPPNVPAGVVGKMQQKGAGYYSMFASLDVEVGRLLDELDVLGIGRDTTVVLSSDHGDLLYSHGWAWKQKPYEEATRVPLVLRGGRYGPELRDLSVGLLDLPTTLMLDHGVAPPGAMQGGHLLDADGDVYLQIVYPDKTSWIPYEQWRGVVSERWKYVVSQDGSEALFDLPNDPYEQNSVAASRGAQLTRMRRLVRAKAFETGDDFFG
jgi:arylsulfatase A-like enzyme